MTQRLAHSASMFALAFVLSTAAEAADQERPADIVAAQVRAQGHTCETPTSAKRDTRASKPDFAVWILTCKNVTYRVGLTPDMRARIEALGE